MKQFFAWCAILLLLMSLCGCRREQADDNALFVPDTPPSEIYTADDPSKQEQNANQYGYYNNYKKLSQEQLNGITTLKNGDEKVYRYDPEVLSQLPSQVSPNTMKMQGLIYCYSDLMELIGTNGIIAAGYATGLRETHNKLGEIGYTLTDFVVTDLYYGSETASAIKIKEGHLLMLEDGYGYYYVPSKDTSILKNNKKVLLYLSKEEKTGYYTISYPHIPLSADYRNYNDAYLTGLLDFFRGDKTEYRNQEKPAGAQPTPSTVVNGQTVYYYDLIPTFFWPEREISDEDLLAEMNDHVVVRTATEYKIVIWPYGHKNYTGGYGTSQFHEICMP